MKRFATWFTQAEIAALITAIGYFNAGAWGEIITEEEHTAMMNAKTKLHKMQKPESR